jgi:hypothetical protein
VGASLQWVPVFSGCQSLVGASLQWVPVFSGCQSSVGASVSGCQFQRVPASVQSLVGAHPHDIEADSGALCYTEKEQKSKSDVDRPVSGFWLDRS